MSTQHLGRILERLRTPPGFDDCYYTSLDSILIDLQAIAENCMLYNSPESQLVGTCNNLISTFKRSIVTLINQNEREGKIHDRPKPDTSTKIGNSTLKKMRHGNLTIPYNLNTPFKFPIQGNYQRFDPDGTCAVEGDQANSTSGWIPQCGDSVLYSMSKHKQFVKDRMDSLSEEHCIVPDISKERSAIGNQMDEISLPASNDDRSVKEAVSFFSQVRSQWLEGTIMSIRSGFPNVHSSKEGSKPSIATKTTIFIIELRLRYSAIENTIVVCWCPCQLESDSTAHHGSGCLSFGLSQESFLQPAWIVGEGVEILPCDLPSTTNTRFVKDSSVCFDFLKRRCLNGIPVDAINRDKALENAERGCSTKPGTRLPSFDDFLTPPNNSLSGKELSKRGAKRDADESTIAAMYKLSDSGYLPLWTCDLVSVQQETATQIAPLRHETLLPFPNLCLELVRLRIVHGYYRNPLAILNDISEAYVASVFFLLYGPSTRSNDSISIRRITRHLASPKGNGKISKSSTKREGNKKATDGSGVKKKIQGKPGQEENKENTIDEFTPEEIALIDRISRIRKTHAFAFTCVTATTQVERLFCFRFTTKAQPPPVLSDDSMVMSAITYNDEQLAAIYKIRYLLKAVGRDPSRNRFKFADTGRYKIRIKCGEQVVATRGLFEKNDDGTILFEPAYLIACTQNSPGMKVRISVSGEIVYGEPIVSPQPTSLAPALYADTSVTLSPFAPNGLSSTNPIYGDESIHLDWQMVDKNEDLARVLFGRPGNRYPCFRCQVQGASLLRCRVRRGHSNPDFGLVENFQGSGRVDSALLQPWRASTQRDQPMDIVDEKNEATVDEFGAVEKETMTSSSTETEAAWEQRAAEAKDSLKKAEKAYKMSCFLYTQAELLSNAEIRLSDEFVSDSFPFDPDDGHYMYCTVCGLSGNLLCCDAPNCPNVVHPKCIGIDLKDIPEDDDWYCSKCVVKGLRLTKRPPSADTLPASGVESALKLEPTSTTGPPGRANHEAQETAAQACDEANQKSNFVESDPVSDKRQGNGYATSLSSKGETPIEKSAGLSPEIRLLTGAHMALPHETPSGMPSGLPILAPKPYSLQQNTIASQKQPPPPCPDITDDEVDEKLSIVNDLLSELREKRGPTARELKEKESKRCSVDGDDDHDDDDEIEGEEVKTSQKRKRGRPRKHIKLEEEISNKSTRDEIVEDPLESLSELARNFLHDICIDSGDAFLEIATSQLGERLNEWRKDQEMKPLAGNGNMVKISSWKSIVRRAVAIANKKPASRHVVVPPEAAPPQPRTNRSIEKRAAAAAAAASEREVQQQNTPPAQRSRRSIEVRAAAQGATDQGPPAKRHRGLTPTRRLVKEEEEEEGQLYDNPLDNLPALGKNFCAWLGVSDAQDFLDRKTSELADEFREYRSQEKMKTLNGSGHGAYVSTWKSQVRRDLAFLTTSRDDTNVEDEAKGRYSQIT